jgi:hypothetical protein
MVANKQKASESSRNGVSTYEPISSVWEGSDGELLELMFDNASFVLDGQREVELSKGSGYR